jgi:hypothetical protein
MLPSYGNAKRQQCSERHNDAILAEQATKSECSKRHNGAIFAE